MKFLDLFAGIGGFRLGMESAGHECVGFCEIDKYARASYKAIHNTEGEIELHDITTVTDEEIRNIGHVDVICGGFPCQSFSIAGSRRGFEDTRGTLFFEIARFADILKPKYLFLENVKGLLNHDRGNTFKTILGALDGLGYDAEWQVLNSKNFSVPQNRERVFIIGHLREGRTRRVFPIIGENAKSDNQQSKIEIVGNTKNPNGTRQGTRSIVHSANGIIGTLTATDYKEPKQVAIPVLTPDRAEKRQNGRRFKTDGEPMFTLTAQDRHGVVVENKVKQVGNLIDTELKGLSEGFRDLENRKRLIRAILFGYEVEKEPKYTVRVKGINGYGQYLNKASSSKTYCFASEIEKYGYKTKHTRKELEDAGFGWVFDCEGVEVQEVTE